MRIIRNYLAKDDFFRYVLVLMIGMVVSPILTCIYRFLYIASTEKANLVKIRDAK